MDAISRIHKFDKFGSVLGLERINSLLEILGNPERDLKAIHVAGTNGKGSISRYIYQVLIEAGFSVGIYTSPFIEVFNERIELNGGYISDEDLETYTDRVIKASELMVERGEDSPTEFEIITAVMFLYFKEKGTDYVVLEVGLGGTGDSTNVIKSPLVSVIASISYDHTDRLGNTLTEIAGEKAGIIKENCPVVTSARSEEALLVIEKRSKEKNSELIETKDFPFEIREESLSGTEFSVSVKDNRYENIRISMLGKHQVENAICALTVAITLRDRYALNITDENIYNGLKKAKQIGRFEVLSENPLIVIDGAHNPDGARTLYEAVDSLIEKKKILFVTGMLADKDVYGALSYFTKVAKDFVVTEPNNPRKMKAHDLAKSLEDLGANVVMESDPKGAMKYALENAKNYDAVIFSGSLYLIGEIRTLINAEIQIRNNR